MCAKEYTLSTPKDPSMAARSPVGTAFRLAIIALLVAFVLPSLAAAQRVVAVGDIHGDFDAFVRILRQTGLIDEQQKWAGGKSTLVQTGDFLDRGPRVREVMDLLMALEKQSRKAGGRVLVLLGNHEVMNIAGDLRYVTPQNFLSFAGKDAEKRRKSAYRQWLDWRKQRAEFLKQPAPPETPALEAEWMSQHPPGYFEQREAFSPSGKYGKWLRSKPAIARVGDVVFVHGGISPQLPETQVETIAQRVRDELARLDDYRRELAKRRIAPAFLDLTETGEAVRTELEFRKAGGAPPLVSLEENQQTMALLEGFLQHETWFSFHPDGPLWFRGYAQWPEAEGDPSLTSVLSKLGARHVVVGHTPQAKGEINSRFGGKVFLIDTGMLASFFPGGQASALEIADGKFTAIYLDRRALLFPPQTQPQAQPATDQAPATTPVASVADEKRIFLGPDGKPLPFSSDEEIMEFLRRAKLVSMKSIGEGITDAKRCLFEHNGVRMHAVFRDVDVEKTEVRLRSGGTELMFRDSALFEPAAYELARLLGLDNVPPAVRRSLRGTDGSLQIWIENAMTETTRRIKKKIPPPEPEGWQRQMDVVKVFDALVYNTDRNLGNLLIDQNWKLWMIDHTRAFRRFTDLQEPVTVKRCERRLLERMKQLEKTSLRASLKRYLRDFEIEAILKRRDKLVAHIEQLIRERGEQAVLYTMDAPLEKTATVK
ncbi:MAG: metallophosphoesterase [Acidobacteriales bacterium]|nr:metallophosphoesterase [Terriglobales bacterium]